MGARSWEKVLAGKPRILELAEREAGRIDPPDRKRTTPAKTAETWRPLMGSIASGEIPYSSDLDEMIGTVLEDDYRRQRRGM